MAAETELQSLLVRLKSDASKYIKGLRNATKETDKFARSVDVKIVKSQGSFVKNTTKMGVALRKLSTQLKTTGKAMTSFGRSMALRVTAPIGVVGGLAVKSFASFDKAMIESTSIMKVTGEQTRQMRNLALSLGQEGIQGPAELAKSYFFLASAGLDAEQSMAALPQVARFATAGAFDMALATDLLTDAQSALGLSSKDAGKNLKNLTRLSDVLVKANTLANTSVQQVSEALTNTAGASLRAFSKDVEEGVAVLAAFADQGVKSNVAGTNLSRVMLLLSKASRKNSRDHKRLGFAVFDTAGKMRNFADIVGNIEDITRGMSDETKSATLEMLGFEARVQQAILPLLGTSNAIRTYENELRKARDITAEIAEKQLKAFSNQMTILKNKVTAVGIEIGDMLIPWITKLTDKVKEGIEAWKNYSDETKKGAVDVTAMVAALAPMVIGVGLASQAIAFAVGGLGKLVSVVRIVTVAIGALVGITSVLQVAIIGAFVVGLASSMRSIARLDPQLKEYNKSLREFRRLQGETLGRDLANTSITLATVAVQPAAQRTGFIEGELDKAINNLQGMRVKVIANRKEAEKLKPTWRSLGQAGKAIWQAQINQLDALILRTKIQRNLVVRLTEELEKSKKADSSRGGRLAKNKAAQEDLGARIGGAITGALTGGVGLLEKVGGAISEGRNKLAMSAFKRSFNVAQVANRQRIQSPLSSRQAVRAGSAQAQQRLAEFRARTGGNARQKPEVKLLEGIKAGIDIIAGTNQEIADKEGADLEVANL